ncbi:MAG: transglutaminase-like domain-containing protein [Bacteroidales bacterium]|nr:transglutaminase-like domain-containing protein [Bacteroidales bacterium]
MRKFAYTLILSIVAMAMSAGNHFITDQAYRAQVKKDYAAKVAQLRLDVAKKGGNASVKEQEALQFLYAYMPVADATDYTYDFFLNNVRATFKAQQEMAWGKQVPELLFRHFVLPLRVNNEALDNARIEFYKELKDRVKGLGMKEAILEVNHWCHEHVTYQPSDSRTLSPMACKMTAIGRCGEESTFAVAALRSVGIPARQVYTPRWAHTDDNHAWVEAWADGKWYFLGACEPEAILNLGWFNAPASRALLMHTRAFGDYRGPEEVMLRSSNYTEINLVDNYGATARIDFKVVDAQGSPVENAQVEFKIYNYNEFYTAVNKYTDAQGRTFLTAGLGDMMVWASKNGVYGYRKVSFGKDKDVTVTLTHSAATDARQKIARQEEFDIVPPPEKVNLPRVSDEMKARNAQRLATEDSIRKAYEATFYQGAEYGEFDAYLKKARGNWRTIKAFIDKHADNKERVMALFKTMSEKDFRDVTMALLDDSYDATDTQIALRVEAEMLVQPYKQVLKNAFPKKEADAFRANPALLAAWVSKNITLNPDKGALRIAQTPVGVWQSRFTDARSRDIFFVDMARSLNIEAQKDAVTGKVQYKHHGEWVDVNFEAQQQTAAATGTLVLKYEPTKILDDPKYYYHFSISKIVDGRAVLLNYDEGGADTECTSWANTFKDGAKMDVGTYLLVSGTRLASGSVLAHSQVINIREGETTEVNLVMRTSDEEVCVIGNFNSESKFEKYGADVSVLSQTGRGYFVIGVLGVGQEPTNHAMRDIAKAAKALNEWGRPLVLLFADEKEMARFQQEDFGTLPTNVVLGIDRGGKIKADIIKGMKLDANGALPVFIIADTFNRVVFVSQGYTIGLGDQLVKTIKGL